MGNWAELQQDLLILIAKRIDQLEDFLAFGRVCRSWRSVAAVRQNFIGSQQIPWLMLAEEEEEEDDKSSSRDERRFCSLIKGEGNMIRKVNLPEARGKRCMESLGWFLTIAEDGDMNLLHPFSRVQIGLPHLTTFKYHDYDGMTDNFMFIQKAVLSSSPSHSHNKDFVLMVIYGGRGFLGFWRPGDKTWITIETRQGAYRDIAYYKGQFYGVDTQGKVFVCDVGGPDPTLARFVGGIPGVFLMFKRPYIIVESAGALLIVVRDGYQLNFLTDNEEEEEEDHDLDYDNLDESTIDYGTNEFRVFELDLSNQRWTELNSLGDKALFVGHSASISVDEASKFPGIRTNCIYYTDDCWEAYADFKRGGGKDMGIYNLEDGSRTPCYKGGSFSPICPPIWVTPSFF